MEIKTITTKPTTLNQIKLTNSEYNLKGYIEDLRKNYACPTSYKLVYSTNNMKIFHEEMYHHTVCYGYDPVHNDWYEFAECSFMVHYVEF